jgi:hypothetical protein
MHHEDMCAKSLNMKNVVALVSELVKEMNNCQFKDFLSDTESEYGAVA